MTITEFLLARIAEDEDSLRLASDYECWHGIDRELRECEAKRRILYSKPNHDTLTALAAVYSDHPGYRAEWKP